MNCLNLILQIHPTLRNLSFLHPLNLSSPLLFIAMEYFTLELILKSATVMKDLHLSFLPVYAVFSLNGDPHVKQEARSPIRVDGGTITNAFNNPPIKFRVNQSLALWNQLTLKIKFVGQHRLNRRLEDISLVHIPVKELLDKYENGKSFQDDSYQLWKPRQNPNGALQFSYRFVIPPKKPLMPYPSPAAGTTSASQPLSANPPPPPQHPAQTYVGYPPHPGYGYPPAYNGYVGYPPHPGYGYPPQPGYEYPPAYNGYAMALATEVGREAARVILGNVISGGFDDGSGYDF